VNVEAEVEDDDPLEVHVLHDPENPKIVEGELFPYVKAFRKAIRHHAVSFAFAPGGRSDKSRFIAKCAAKGCPWRTHAYVIWDKKTVHVPFTLLHMCVFTIAYPCFILHYSHVFVLVSSFVQIKKLSPDHNFPTTKLVEGKTASQGWCADRIGEWVKKNPTKGAKEAKEKLESDYDIKLKYSKAWSGLKVALEQIHGTYEESFQLVFNWAAHLEQVSPGSHVEIEVEKCGKKNRFKRVFVALKPCIDGFLAGCRPFIGVDASFLHGKYTGQLATSSGVDGHNWLYHIAYVVFDSKDEGNWE
jgi:hypothetical protein